MDEATRREIDRVLGDRLREACPLRRSGTGLSEIGRAWPRIDSLTDEELRTFFYPRLDRLLEHVEGCFPCTAKALVLAILVARRRQPGLADEYEGMLQNHLNRLVEANNRRRDYGAEVETVLAMHAQPAGK